MVTPIRATLSAAQPVIALTVRNDGAEQTVVQVDTLSWAQREGDDVYAPTREIIATPPIFSIAPGASQAIRVGLRRQPDDARELTYRVSLQEVPPPPKADFKGLRVALRMIVPIFVMPPAATAPRLQWRVAPAGPGALSVALRNDGNAHVHVTRLRLESAGQELGQQLAPGYVLPGQSRAWLFKGAAATGATLRVVASTDGGDVQSEMQVEER
jgi:fimbrial chaperone protein